MEEQKQKKRSEAAFKEFGKKAVELRSTESKYGRHEGYGKPARRSPVLDKHAKLEALKARAEEEKNEYEKSVGITRAMTLNNLQTEFPNVFSSDWLLETKRLLL